MTRGTKKADLPSKICPVCHRPFAWRKKWERNWDEVRYCSERCRRDAKGAKSEGSGFPRVNSPRTTPNA